MYLSLQIIAYVSGPIMLLQMKVKTRMSSLFMMNQSILDSVPQIYHRMVEELQMILIHQMLVSNVFKVKRNLTKVTKNHRPPQGIIIEIDELSQNLKS